MSTQVAENVPEYEPAVDYDGYYSVLISFTVHLVTILTLWLLSMVIVEHKTSAPAIQVVQVAEADGATGPTGDMMPAGDSPAATSNDAAPADAVPDVPVTEAVATERIEKQANLDKADKGLREAVSQRADDARRAAAAAKAAVAGKMRDNLGGGTPGGGSGGGRAGRAARWILQFDTSNAKSYLTQLGGLGAEVAFPQRGDKFLYFSDLAGTPKSDTRDLSRETRIYWMDENPSSFLPVARDLGVAGASLMVAFLPENLEGTMLKMELAHRGVQSEDEILQTVFKCIQRGGKYDVMIVKQTLRNE